LKSAENIAIEQMKAVLLVGGLGTRLRSVTTGPKPLAEVGGSPFLELLIRQLRSQGVRRLVMCTGYLGDQVEATFGDGGSLGVSIEYSREASPLGTAGAIKLAAPYLLEPSDFVVMNGDSFLEIDLPRLVRFHFERGGIASMAVLKASNAGRFGTVRTDAAGRVDGFAEKAGREEPGTINGGIYVFNRRVLDTIPDGPASLERDVFPELLRHGIYALEQEGTFIDIGTPEEYARAQQIHAKLSAHVGANIEQGVLKV
jgi:D-glycero-alpha-D-manno-heptose 1-phosphate guanylyltransferase